MTPPVQLVPLSNVITNAPDDQEPAPDFVPTLDGKHVQVTAVLERTAVVAPLTDRWADKQLVRHADLLMDPAAITRRSKRATGFRAKFRRRYASEQREALRAASDRRAMDNRARLTLPYCQAA
ncbi:MAG: hypothetical protein E6J41_24685 [Chloroflexi bacterium]|nr:MAG: hypothetical protein E6J41_24685 [Chloroflexota bacterium]